MSTEPLLPSLLFGVPIDDLTMVETLDLVEELAADGRAHARTHQIATVNVDFLVNALHDADGMRVLQHADVCMADGMPVLWGGKLAGMPLRERVAGADLVPALAERSAATGLHLYFFGSRDGVAERAADRLRERHPGTRITADSGPMMRDVREVDAEVLDRIAAAEPDVLCVALGNPKQERFIEAHRDRLGIPVLIGIGGSLDMLIGDKKRAPGWAQRAGLEWVYRAAQEPGRLGKRYAHDGRVFGPKIAAYVRAIRKERAATDAWHLIASDTANHYEAVPSTSPAAAARSIVPADPAAITVDLGGAPRLTIESLQRWSWLTRTARRHGASPSVTGRGAGVDAQLQRVGLTTHFDA